MLVIWTKGALADLEEIQDYIALDSPLNAYPERGAIMRLFVQSFRAPSHLAAAIMDLCVLGRIIVSSNCRRKVAQA